MGNHHDSLPSNGSHGIPADVYEAIVERWTELDKHTHAFERIAERLSRLPNEVWKLPINWSAYAEPLDDALNVTAPTRTEKEQREAHEAIASALRRAAQKLAQPGEADPRLYNLLGLLRRNDQVSWRMPFYKLLGQERFGTEGAFGPNLSEFLRAIAELYEGDGQLGRVAGIATDRSREGWTTGKRSAPAQAFENATRLIRTLTDRPHYRLCEEMVRSYHPKAGAADFARAARARERKSGKTGEK